MARTREAQFSDVGDSIEKYLKGKGYVRLGRESVVPIVWPEVVGEWYAKHTEVTRVEQGIVTVACDSAPRAQQLQLDAPQIVKALNDRIGGRSVKEIRPSSGAIRRLDKVAALAPDYGPLGPERSELERMIVTDAERDWVRASAGSIEDLDLKRRFEGVLMKARQLARWQTEHGYAPCQGCGALVRPGRVQCSACDPGRTPRQGTDEVIPWKADYKWD